MTPSGAAQRASARKRSAAIAAAAAWEALEAANECTRRSGARSMLQKSLTKKKL